MTNQLAGKPARLQHGAQAGVRRRRAGHQQHAVRLLLLALAARLRAGRPHRQNQLHFALPSTPLSLISSPPAIASGRTSGHISERQVNVGACHPVLAAHQQIPR